MKRMHTEIDLCLFTSITVKNYLCQFTSITVELPVSVYFNNCKGSVENDCRKLKLKQNVETVNFVTFHYTYIIIFSFQYLALMLQMCCIRWIKVNKWNVFHMNMYYMLGLNKLMAILILTKNSLSCNLTEQNNMKITYPD